ncbi:hypothetical protein H7E67_13215 [Clostridium gasigenes]|uniref:hypothetical protein n=1 Tax=Clostridium gasigenes TaxID=94869 RepID=UPI00162838C9|nr:hypothetical protein [Clostridium gasigenes]MBB6624395.1 hypothetical protein [Clostridium gasigenes]MBU3088710.1 hypothetical protein [Clostridium gasigenes]
MNLNINQAQPINYTNKQFKNNKDEKFSLELTDKQISEEEDKKLYERYKNSIMLSRGFSFEELKKSPRTFPPVTAPGAVRKAWREQCEKCAKCATEKEQVAMGSFAIHCSEILESKKGTAEYVPNDLNGYLDFIGDMKDYLRLHCYNVPGQDNKIYEDYMNIANGFESELKKYQ